MNIYFINPQYLNPDRIDIFLEILKVKRIINLIPFDERDRNILDVCKIKCIYNIENDNLENGIKRAVYSFIKPMSNSYLREDGTVTFIYNDLYRTSRARNLIYNLEYCDDDNLMVFVSGNEMETCKKYSNLLMNIFNKYASTLHYENRVGIYFITNIITNVYYVFENKSINTSKYNGKFGDYYYTPLLSYIALKLKDKTSLIDALDINYFFLSNKGYQEYEKVVERWKRKQEELDEERMCNMYDDSNWNDWGQQEELKYIYENGGDWILD